ncbi:hypothetical protein BD626DRAFT_528174 [Schizophyllum amplum]|uniref:Uncharacterized protein n=1 Tax=Schizophyllum amplum TaxID=97359 RepID=A0A550BS20_9AGAR|nr:hypothetical protein BD626DRAFT_528174 [Auriculariopsis ampla]
MMSTPPEGSQAQDDFSGGARTIDPRTAFLNSLQAADEANQPASHRDESPHQALNEDPNEESAFGGGSDPCNNDLDLTSLGLITSLSSPACKAFTDRMHHLFGLTGSELGLEEYRQAQSSIEANYILLCSIKQMEMALESRRTAQPNSTPHWKMSSSLAAAAKRYTKVFLYSHKLSSYRASNGPELIIRAMREANVSDLPDASGSDDAELSSYIRGQLTTYRSQIKGKVFQSLDKQSPLHNLADLTGAILHSESAAKVTLQMFMRVACLRWHAMKYPADDSEVDWWRAVDETLAFNKKNLTQVNLERANKKYYDDDIAVTGKNPADSKVQAVDPSTVPKWIRKVNDLTVDAVAYEGASKKRRFA